MAHLVTCALYRDEAGVMISHVPVSVCLSVRKITQERDGLLVGVGTFSTKRLYHTTVE